MGGEENRGLYTIIILYSRYFCICDIFSRYFYGTGAQFQFFFLTGVPKFIQTKYFQQKFVDGFFPLRKLS